MRSNSFALTLNGVKLNTCAVKKNRNNKTMDQNETIEKLKKILKPYIQDEEGFKNLNLKTNFISDLKINSANLVDVILDVEDEFDIEIDNEAMEKMMTVEAAIEIVKEKQG